MTVSSEGVTLGEVAEAKATKKKGPPPPRDPKVEYFERELPCVLTDVEKAEMSQERCYLGQRVDALTEAMENYVTSAKTEVARRKDEIAGIISTDRSIRINLGNGTIQRLTRCVRTWHYDRRPQPLMIESRLDTSPPAQLSERAMTPEESDEGIGSWVGTAFDKVTKTGPSHPQTDDGIIDDSIPFGGDDEQDIDFE